MVGLVEFSPFISSQRVVCASALESFGANKTLRDVNAAETTAQFLDKRARRSATSLH